VSTVPPLDKNRNGKLAVLGPLAALDPGFAKNLAPVDLSKSEPESDENWLKMPCRWALLAKPNRTNH
jgi:hypothetical protein